MKLFKAKTPNMSTFSVFSALSHHMSSLVLDFNKIINHQSRTRRKTHYHHHYYFHIHLLMYQQRDPHILLQSFDPRIVSRYGCITGSHDARICGACLRAGVHTIVLETNQMIHPTASKSSKNNSRDLTSSEMLDKDLIETCLALPPKNNNIINNNSGSPGSHRRTGDIDENLRDVVGITPLLSVVVEPVVSSSATNESESLEPPSLLRWMLFVDESNQNVNFITKSNNNNNSLSQPFFTLNTLIGAPPLPPISHHLSSSSSSQHQKRNNNNNKRLVSAMSFGHGAVEIATSIILSPLRMNNPWTYHHNNDDNNNINDMNFDFDDEAALSFVASSLSNLQDVCTLSSCKRPLLMLQGQCVNLSGTAFLVRETEPAGCIVLVTDDTCVAVAAPDQATEDEAANLSFLMNKAASADIDSTSFVSSSSPFAQAVSSSPGVVPSSNHHRLERIAQQQTTSISPIPSVSPSVPPNHHHQRNNNNNNNSNDNDNGIDDDDFVLSPPNADDTTPQQHQHQKGSKEVATVATSPTPPLSSSSSAKKNNSTNGAGVDYSLLRHHQTEDNNNNHNMTTTGISPIQFPQSEKENEEDDYNNKIMNNNKNNNYVSSSSETRSWYQRYLDLMQSWDGRFIVSNRLLSSSSSSSALFPTPAHLCEGIRQLALACNALQECNNDITMFLTRNNAETSFLLQSIPASTDTLIGKRRAKIFLEDDDDNDNGDGNKNKKNSSSFSSASSSYFIEVLLIMFPDPEQVCVALELEGIRVAECWACHSTDSVYVAVKIKTNSTSSTNHNSSSSSRDQNELALNQLFVKDYHHSNNNNNHDPINQTTILILGERRGVTKLDHTVLDDLHRMLEWHSQNVDTLYKQVFTGGRGGNATNNNSNSSHLLSCWNFIMDSFGSDLSELVKDIRMELDKVVSSAAEASDQAFHKVEEALAEFRSTTTRRSDNNNDNNARSIIKTILDSFSHAVAHEVAGEEDLKARDLVFEMWSWFELLGIGYEKVVSKVPEFRSKLLIGTITDSNEVLVSRSLRSHYQEAVELMRSCYYEYTATTNDIEAQEQERKKREGPRVKRQLEEKYFSIVQKLQGCLDRLVSTARETDVFAGDLTVAELWSSDYKNFQEYDRIVDEWRGENL